MPLRPICRLEPGQTSRDCAPGTAGETEDGRLDLADLVMTDAGRATWLRAVGAKLGAATPEDGNRLFHQIVDPAIEKLNRGDRRNDKEAEMAEKDCGCDHTDGGEHADTDYDDMGNITPAAAARRARAMLTQPSSYRRNGGAPVRNDVAPNEADDTDEDAAKARLKAANAAMFRGGSR